MREPEAVVNIDLLYIDGCPNRHIAQERTTEALRRAGLPDVRMNLVLVSTEDDAHDRQFPGSPTLRLDGRDLFPSRGGAGLACRVYTTPHGLAGAPTVEQIVEAITPATSS